MGVFSVAVTGPALDSPPAPDASARLAIERPDVADRVIALHAALRDADARVQMVEEVLASGVGARMPWETVRDWFHDAGNCVDPLDRAAEALAGAIAGTEEVSVAELARRPIGSASWRGRGCKYG